MVRGCAFVTAAVGLWLFAAQPAWRGLQGASEQLAQRRLLISGAQTMPQQTARLKQEVADLKAVADSLTIYTDDPVPAMIERIAGAARDSGVRVANFVRTPPKNLTHLTRWTLSIGFDAPFPTVARFLYELEDPVRKLTIAKVEMNAVRGGGNRVMASVTISAYTVRSQPASTAPAGKHSPTEVKR